jgi:hypothetical protein
MEKFNKLVEALESIKTDAEKFYVKENAAAGKRLRAGLKVVADAAKGLRKHVSEVKNERKATDAPATPAATPAGS